MKALIFNSGIGKRMGELTANNPKSMVKLNSGETVFERQIRLLSDCGVKDFVITTGPFEEQLIAVTQKCAYRDCNFTFVNNDLYDKTNYIYSFYLARNYIDDDFLVLHGDLVFDKKVVEYILSAQATSTCMINADKELPEKDFKGRIKNGKLKEVSINIFDNDCYTFQPFYKLDKKTIQAWLAMVCEYIENRHVDSVYAENALNEITDNLNIVPISYKDYYLEEIDNLEDYNRVKNEIDYFDYKEQEIVYSFNSINDFLKKNCLEYPLVVMDSFLSKNALCNELNAWAHPIFFSEFKPNPDYKSVVEGIRMFKDCKCDCIISIGGGSAIDTAKAIKLFLPLDCDEASIPQDREYINVKHIAVPTTAGTGSESTRFAAIYFNGVKNSLTSHAILPDLAVLEKCFVKTLPIKQKSATILDALCQATESIWSVNATEQSQKYSAEAIKIILANIKLYMDGDDNVIGDMQKAANLSGKAINISETTAAHAMSYKVTSLFGIPHGDAVALCMRGVWDYYNKNSVHAANKSKFDNVERILSEAYGVSTIGEARDKFIGLCEQYLTHYDIKCEKTVFDNMVNEVNPERLKNFPIALDSNVIRDIYQLFISFDS